jgi:hypothetical protein
MNCVTGLQREEKANGTMQVHRRKTKIDEMTRQIAGQRIRQRGRRLGR